jgi:hypothetical protein
MDRKKAAGTAAASLKKTRKRSLKKDDPTWPHKYYKGLTRKAAATRRKEILKFGKLHWKNSRAYTGFKTDKGVKGKPSNYTQRFRRLFPDVASLEDKAKATGVPLRFLKASYNRGQAAWRTGHRPGATEAAWGHARTSSLLVCGKTAETADSDIVREAKAASATAKKWFKSQGC